MPFINTVDYYVEFYITEKWKLECAKNLFGMGNILVIY